MDKGVLHRGRLGEDILRDSAFSQYFQDQLEMYFDELISTPAFSEEVKTIHARMLEMTAMANKFAAWHRMAKLEEDELNNPDQQE